MRDAAELGRARIKRVRQLRARRERAMRGAEMPSDGEMRGAWRHEGAGLTYPFHTPVEQAPEGAQTRMHTPIACASAPGLARVAVVAVPRDRLHTY